MTVSIFHNICVIFFNITKNVVKEGVSFEESVGRKLEIRGDRGRHELEEGHVGAWRWQQAGPAG